MLDRNEQPDFVRIPNGGDLAPGRSRAFSIGLYEVAVFNVEGELFALENCCPHQGGPLAEGFLEGELLTCPWHGWCFDVRTGRMTLGDFARVPQFEVRRDGQDLLIATQPRGTLRF